MSVLVARAPEDLAPLKGPFVMTVGVFDGVHRGHARILEALTRQAGAHGASSVVVTLDPHPLRVLRPEIAPPMLTTAAERVELLERHGPDAVLVLPFDRTTAEKEPDEFLRGLLPQGKDLAALVIGHDFRMGRGRSAGREELERLGEQRGFSVVAVGAEGGDEPISSTRIRRLVEEGDMGEAARLLGHLYLIRGNVVRGRGIGRTLDFPTANVDVGSAGKLLPGMGVYAVLVGIVGEEGPDWPGVMNFGVRPTFGATEPTLEVHLPGFSGDLGGRELCVRLVERIRGERRFESPGALASRIREDVAHARKILGRLEI